MVLGIDSPIVTGAVSMPVHLVARFLSLLVVTVHHSTMTKRGEKSWKRRKWKARDVSSLTSLMNAYERALIIDALVSTQGNQSQAAKLLGTSKRVIHYKIHKFGIDPRRFRMGN